MVNNVDKIKEKVDIVELISGYLKLQKAGVNYKANCPFHNEKTPSFTVSVERQFWYCFGCARGGDHFSFVQEIEGVDFPEALRILARKAGIELEQFDRSFQNAKTRLLAVSELAVKFFQKQLWKSNSGQKALAYLTNRGLKKETVEDFKLGFAPDSWQGLIDFLKNCSFRDQEIFEAGLSVRRENASGYYDRFRSRIMFPIFDLNGQAVGFTGRVFETRPEPVEGREPGAKYINTPQTLIYDKSRILYGLQEAKMSIRSQDKCLLMEGNMDVIMSHQAGVLNAVASSGTALTEQHLKTIRRYTNNLDLCFDHDAAGQQATDRGIGLALQQDFNLGVVLIDDPACKDPADYVQQYGAKRQDKAKETRSIFDFHIETACQQFDPATANGKKVIAQKVLPLIGKITSAVERAHWIGELAFRLQTKEDVLNKELEALAGRWPAPLAGTSASPRLAEAGPAVLEDYLLSLLMIKPDLARQAEQSLISFCSAKVKLFLGTFINYLNEANRPANPVDFLLQTAAGEAEAGKMYWEKLYLGAQERWPAPAANSRELQTEFTFIINQLQKRNVTARLAELEMAIKQAEKQKDKKLVVSLVGEFQKTADILKH
ncbi:MAG: DNA primase [Parcubacteria group bacterium Gr01-1014_44]|nr:MAG: DNA primase [Parcubacteria group bacterium Gr01-1014_44]